MQSKFSKKLAMIIVTILTVSVISAAIPFASATITDRPTVYRGDGTTSAPVTIEAGTDANIDTSGMTITGAQIWLWLSTTGGSEINVALGDRPYAGPFLLSELTAAGPYSYTFTPANIAGLCTTLSADSPFAGEQRSYTYTIGGDWINGTIPLKVQGEDVDYWIKIADVSPADVIAGSEIGVSTNRVHFLPGFDATPLMSAPETTVTVSGYALPATSEYNVTEDGDTVLGLLLPGTYDEGGWVWTGFSNAFNIEDLENKLPFGSTPPPSTFTPVNITVWENDTATDLATWDFEQYWREVYLEDENSAGALNFRGDTGDYSGTVTLETGATYDVEIEFFPAFGTASVYLDNTLVTSGVALNGTGGVLTTVTIPSLTTDDYTFCVKDNNNVMYNFTVHVVMVPYIYCTPDTGYVGDSFSVTGVNFLDYVGDYITVYFEDTNPTDYVLLWNQTIASSTWTTGALTVPSSWGGIRRVEARDISGYTSYANTTFTVLTMINVIPDAINSSVCETVEVEGTGFFYGTDDVEGWLVFIDNSQYFGYWDFFHYGISDTGDVMFEFATAGFRPGLHVVSVIPQSFGILPWTIEARDCFVVTTVGDPIVAYLEGMNATVMALDGTIATLDTTIGELQVDLAAVGATVTSISGDVATIKTDVGTIKSSLSTLSASVSSVSGSMATIQTSIGQIITELTSLDTVIGSMYGDVVALDTSIGSVETSLDALDATVSGLGDDMTAVAGDVVSIDTVLGSVAGTVTSMEGTLATIETDLGTAQVDLAYLKGASADTQATLDENLPVDMMPVWIAVILSLIAAIGAIAGVFIIQRKIA